MPTRVLGTLTIGQAPRPDVTPIIDRHVPDAVRRIHRGVLDGLSRAGALDRDPESTSNGSIIEASRPRLGSR